MTKRIPAQELQKFYPSSTEDTRSLPIRFIEDRTMSSMDVLRSMVADYYNPSSLGITAKGYVVSIGEVPEKNTFEHAYRTTTRQRYLRCMIIGSDHGKTDPYFYTYGKTLRDLCVIKNMVAVRYDPTADSIQVGDIVQFTYDGPAGPGAQFRVGFLNQKLPDDPTIVQEICIDRQLSKPGKFGQAQNLKTARRAPDVHRTAGQALTALKLTLPDYGISSWAYPVSSGNRVGSPFGPRVHPISGQAGKMHGGVDLGNNQAFGQSVYAAAQGIVTYIKPGISRAAGHYMEIYHGIDSSSGRGVYTRYLHLKSQGSSSPADDKAVTHAGTGTIASTVQEGRTVSKGEQIAHIGNTGGSTGAHLHFVIYLSSLTGQLRRPVYQTGYSVNPLLPNDAPPTRKDMSQEMQGNPPLTPAVGPQGKPPTC
jgi:murein DD-endopeptidase MepM/ murein hydrolase activator NlpD